MTLVSVTDADPLWYKDAIIYQLHIKSFRDSDADGFGDFNGLAVNVHAINVIK